MASGARGGLARRWPHHLPFGRALAPAACAGLLALVPGVAGADAHASPQSQTATPGARKAQPLGAAANRRPAKPAVTVLTICGYANRALQARTDLPFRLRMRELPVTARRAAMVKQARAARMLILDGDDVRAGARLAPAVEATLGSGGAVLVFDSSPAQRAAWLGGPAGMTTGGRADIVLVRRVDGDGGIPVIRVTEWPTLKSPRKLSAGDLALVRTFVDELTEAILPPKATAEAAQASAAPVPDGMIAAQWQFQRVFNGRLPKPWSVLVRGTVPTQTAVITVNRTFTAFLSNANRPQGDLQYVTYNVNGTVNPAVGNAYALLRPDYGQVKAWWTGKVETTAAPRDPWLAWVTHAPAAANATAEYSSGTSVNIGFTASAKAGASGSGGSGDASAGVSSSFGFTTGRKYAIPQWSVSAIGSGRDVGWSWRATDPCDVDAPLGNNGCFIAGPAWDMGNPREPNPLSKSQMTFDASAAWRTSSVESRTATFDVSDRAMFVSSYCAAAPFHGGTIAAACWPEGGSGRRMDTHWLRGNHQISIDLGAVVPVPIASVELRAGGRVVDGTTPVAAGEQVTGTVRLARPAAFDVTVDLSSTKENVVAHPDRVRIPKGQTTGTFTLSTNANGLCAPAATPAPCVEVTAIVGAFYAGSHRQPLRVVHPRHEEASAAR